MLLFSILNWCFGLGLLLRKMIGSSCWLGCWWISVVRCMLFRLGRWRFIRIRLGWCLVMVCCMFFVLVWISVFMFVLCSMFCVNSVCEWLFLIISMW